MTTALAQITKNLTVDSWESLKLVALTRDVPGVPQLNVVFRGASGFQKGQRQHHPEAITVVIIMAAVVLAHRQVDVMTVDIPQ